MIDDKKLEYLIDANRSDYCFGYDCDDDHCRCDEWTQCEHCHSDLPLEMAIELADGKLICESCETKRTIKN